LEYYDPTIKTWTTDAKMSVCREGVVIEVNGWMCIIGGYNGEYFKSIAVYRPSDVVGSFIADMKLCRFCPGNYNNFIFKITFEKLYLIEITFLYRSIRNRRLVVCYWWRN